jgi:hypothetical protein
VTRARPTGRCVNQNAVCFDSCQCNYDGFTRKLNVTACVDGYNDLVARYDDLILNYNKLLDGRNDLLRRFDGLASDYANPSRSTLGPARLGLRNATQVV